MKFWWLKIQAFMRIWILQWRYILLSVVPRGLSLRECTVIVTALKRLSVNNDIFHIQKRQLDYMVDHALYSKNNSFHLRDPLFNFQILSSSVGDKNCFLGLVCPHKEHPLFRCQMLLAKRSVYLTLSLPKANLTKPRQILKVWPPKWVV